MLLEAVRPPGVALERERVSLGVTMILADYVSVS
jgi:hypothetical protein